MVTPTPPSKPDILKNIEAGDNIDTTDTERQIALEAVREMNKADRELLMTQVNAYKEKDESELDTEEKQTLKEIEDEIAKIDQQESDRESAEVVTDTSGDAQMEKSAEGMGKVKTAIKKMLKTFMKLPLISTMIRGWVKKNPDSVFGNFMREIVAEEELFDAMARTFGKGNIEKTKTDEKDLRRLRSQYDAIPTKEGVTKMTFEVFYTKKMESAKKRSMYRLSDVADAELDADLAQAEDTRVAAAKAAQEKEAKKLREAAKNKPEVKAAIHVFALARAMSRDITEDFDLDEAEVRKDLLGRTAGETYHYKAVAEKIAAWLYDGDSSAKKSFGLEIAVDGDLESADESWDWWDPDLVLGFHDSLTGDDPINAITDLMEIDVKALNLNDVTTRKLPKLSKAIQEELDKMLNPSAPPPVAPEPEPEPEVAAAPPAKPVDDEETNTSTA